MTFAGILVLAFVFVVLGGAVGLVLLARFLVSESGAEEAMRFDPFARPPPPPSPRLFGFLMFLRNRPKQIGNRRDRRGRFRKRER